MKLKNPILFFIFLIFTLLSIADVITAFFILPGESNPIFILFGKSIYVLIIGKALLLYGVWWYYHRNIYPSNFSYYLLVLVLMLGSLATGFGVWSNSVGIRNPEMVERAAQIPDDVKVKTYSITMSVIYMIPAVFCLLSFIVYDKSHKYIKIDKEYYKQRSWINRLWKKYKKK